MSLKKKILTCQIAVAALPLIAVCAVFIVMLRGSAKELDAATHDGFRQSTDDAKSSLLQTADSGLVQTAMDLRNLCTAQQELLEQKLRADASVAADVLKNAGKVAIGGTIEKWEVTNQFTSDTSVIELPGMTVGGVALGRNADPAKPSPVVDHVRGMVGGACTIFQRMNDNGDMLRVVTNITGGNGRRAIGTYIPAVGPDRTPNAVVASLLAGKRFVGRAEVVGQWYITSYTPIKDDSDKVIGAVFVGVPEQSTTSLRKAIMDVTPGQSGYVYVLAGKGKGRGSYIISKGGKRDGESIWEVKDSAGRPIIQDICNTAVSLKDGQTSMVKYQWKDSPTAEPREKMVALSYFEPWDWVIGVSVYSDEFLAGVTALEQRADQTLGTLDTIQKNTIGSVVRWSIVLGLAGLAVAGLMAWWVARGIANPIDLVAQGLSQGADQVKGGAAQVSQFAQQLASNTSAQASALQETTESLASLASGAKSNAERSQRANSLATQARQHAEGGNATMKKLNTSMEAINESAGQIGKIIKVIEEISFQTNLLALNAAVEAARAGEHGRGFAVVAGEVRNLAVRASDAARQTASLIADSVSRTREGTQVAQTSATALESISGAVSQVADLLDEINSASEEQSHGVSKISGAVADIDRVTQENAAGAEESAGAAEELSSMSVSLKEQLVADLVKIVHGRN